MIIDMNAYLGHWPFRRLRYNAAPELLDLMDEKGIDRACVSSASAIFFKNSQAGNEELAEQIEPYRDKLIPFAVINRWRPSGSWSSPSRSGRLTGGSGTG